MDLAWFGSEFLPERMVWRLSDSDGIEKSIDADLNGVEPMKDRGFCDGLVERDAGGLKARTQSVNIEGRWRSECSTVIDARALTHAALPWRVDLKGGQLSI